MAAYLNKNDFEATYYYTGKAHSGREDFLREHGVRIIQIRAEGISASGKWINTDIFECFDEGNYDIIQTAIAGQREWPYYLIKKPVVQFVAYDSGVDFSSNVYHSFISSQWWRERWISLGGSRRFSSVAIAGIEEPVETQGIRESLGIPKDALVAGFHQRADDNIFSPMPLNAFAAIAPDNSWFLILGGSRQYSEQAARLGIKNFLQLPHTAERKIISSFLNTLDIFAHGRKDGETFGYVFAEALMHKLPCLGHAARGNAHRDTMGPGGLWAENEKEYAQQLKLLFTNPDLRHRLSMLGEHFASENYDDAKAMSQIEHIYHTIYKRDIAYIFTLYVSVYLRKFLNMFRIGIFCYKKIVLRFISLLKMIKP